MYIGRNAYCHGGLAAAFLTIISTWLLTPWLARWMPHVMVDDNQSVGSQGLSDTPQFCNLIIGILSARNNFQQRAAIRDTWFIKESKTFADYCLKTFFVVGAQSCAFPPSDRIDPYDCRSWTINKDELGDHSQLRFTSSLHETEFKKQYRVKSGMSFKVLHPVVISKLGALSSYVKQHQTVNIALVSAATQEEICRVQLSALQTGTLVKGYVYRPIKPLILPKGFEGMIFLPESKPMVNSSWSVFAVEYDNAGGVLDFQYVTDKSDFRQPFVPTEVLAVSFGYSIHNWKELEDHISKQSERQINWAVTLDAEHLTLQKEIQTYGDILVVNVTDVYRNLATKVLRFYEQIVHRYDFHFVLKTDDDTVIGIKGIVKQLMAEYTTQMPNKVWWGKFRKNWLVDLHGKWKEPTYQSVVYPPFACGAANILSSDIVRWLAKNSNDLHPYQGEDVSLGIWISALGPTYKQDDRWECDEGCHPDAFNRVQLTPFEVKESWRTLQECGSMCNCSLI